MEHRSVIAIEGLADIAQRGFRQVSAQIDCNLPRPNNASCPAAPHDVFVRNAVKIFNGGLDHLYRDAFFASADKVIAQKLLYLAFRKRVVLVHLHGEYHVGDSALQFANV